VLPPRAVPPVAGSGGTARRTSGIHPAGGASVAVVTAPVPRPPTPGPPTPAAEVVSAVLAHPAVARLDGGPFGTVASYLPGRRRILGVRIGVGDEPVEIAVVARLGTPLPQLAEELGAAVRGVLGSVAVEVTVSDVVPVVAAAPPPSPSPTGPDVAAVPRGRR
jgi:hypothetical protein